MKNYLPFCFALVMFLAVGCYSETHEAQEMSEPDVLSQELTIQAILECDPETKTTRDPSNGDVLWVPGDAISLFYGSGTDGGSRFVSNATEPSKVTNFTGTITAITGGADVSLEDTYFWGVYPYSDDISCDGTTITMTIPTEQKAVAGTFDTGLFPSIGRSQGLIMGFYNVCGGWRFSVTKEGVRKVTLKSNGGEALTGRVKVGLNVSGIPVIREVLDGSDEVVLECPAGEYFEVGQNYYMTILPGVLSSGFTMTFETYTEEGEYNRTASTTINRSRFAGITNIDNYLTTPYALKSGNIPVEDANFKAYLVANFDQDSDGEISYAEADGIIRINCNDVSSLQGIEMMHNLTTIYCSNYNCSNKLTKLNVSNNTALTWIDCCNNQLTTIDVSNNTALITLYCASNQLTMLDVSHNAALADLYCSYNQLTSLDLSHNTDLRCLSCNGNQLTLLDVSGNSVLTYLDCDHNQLSVLDVSNMALTYLDCDYNQLTMLNVSNNASLTELECNHNQLSTLNVLNNVAMTQMSCRFNQLTSLDVSTNTALSILWCDENQLTALDVSNNLALTRLVCSNNQLTTLNLSNNTALTRLDCSSNQMTSLDVSYNLELEGLYCVDNQLPSLDLSNNVALTICECRINQLTSLDISNTVLTYIDCSSNKLTTLDVSHNTLLTRLDCSSNKLTSLDVSHNTSLTRLNCSPMSTLETLFIFQGQEIPNVTVNRNSNYIPDGVEIVVPATGGGGEGTGDDELNP